MRPFEPADQLTSLADEGLLRRLKVYDRSAADVLRLSSPDGAPLVNFSSNDYLGFSQDPFLAETLGEAAHRYGVGSGASRLVCGTHSPHYELEQSLAEAKRAEAALTFSSGFATAVGVITGLMGDGDIIILDKLCHASLIDGAKASGATLRVYPHNNLGRLESHLQWASQRRSSDQRVLVVTESIFSMDGDLCPLPEIVGLKDRYDAWLLLDEAHALGVIGPEQRGLAAEHHLETQIELQMGTLSKALGLSGGYICASRAMIDLLTNKARSLIYSTAPSPAIAHTARVALSRLLGQEGRMRKERLWQRIDSLHTGLETAGLSESSSAIVPVILGESEEALHAAATLGDSGFLVPAIRFPTVPRNTARLRITLSSEHQQEDVDSLAQALRPIVVSSADLTT